MGYGLHILAGVIFQKIQPTIVKQMSRHQPVFIPGYKLYYKYNKLRVRLCN
jgi:hypothetical protein